MSGEKRQTLRGRIRTGTVTRQDVVRQLARIAFGKANDCVKLAMEEDPCVDTLDLNLISEVKRTDRGKVAVKLIDRLQALEALARLAENPDLDAVEFLRTLQEGEP
ncbi:MAG: terminase small subunit [Oscillospiraceae bacterium]|nr:terminase small subunit [Oscillospiraceae bacterium]